MTAATEESGAGDGVTAADAGEHFPESIEDAIDSIRSGRGVVVGDILRKHGAFGGGVFAIGFDVDGEVFVIARLGHVVVLDEAFDLRFGDGGNLAFVGVERGEAIGGRASGADGAECADEIRSLIPFFGRLHILLRNTEAFGELEPEFGMVRRAGFFVDEVIEQLAAGRLIVAARVDGGEIGREGGDMVIILARVIGERGHAQFAAGPGEIEGMSQKIFRGDLAIDGVEVLVHMSSSDRLVLAVGLAKREHFLISTSRLKCV